MKITTLALSALGLVSFTAAQSGNDPLILNNRTGLDPIVYDTFSTSYTNERTAKSVVSVSLTPSPVRSNTFLSKPSTSIECWRNSYPCGQNGGQRSQRLVAAFVRPTPAIDARVPPPEWFSTHSDVHLPGETDIAGDTGELRYDILPIPTSLGGEPQYDAPPQAPGKTSEAVFSALPISTSTRAAQKSPIPTEWWRGPEGLPASTPALQKPALPSDWWRSPAIPSDWFRLRPSIPSEWLRPAPTGTSSSQDGTGTPSPVIDCSLHWCPTSTLSRKLTTSTWGALPAVSGPVVSSPAATAPVTASHFAPPPTVTPIADAGVPIDWWRGPGQPITPDAPEGINGPIQRYSSIASTSSVATHDACFRHYCPSERSGSKAEPTPRTLLTAVKSVERVLSTVLAGDASSAA